MEFDVPEIVVHRQRGIHKPGTGTNIGPRLRMLTRELARPALVLPSLGSLCSHVDYDNVTIRQAVRQAGLPDIKQAMEAIYGGPLTLMTRFYIAEDANVRVVEDRPPHLQAAPPETAGQAGALADEIISAYGEVAATAIAHQILAKTDKG